MSHRITDDGSEEPDFMPGDAAHRDYPPDADLPHRLRPVADAYRLDRQGRSQLPVLIE
ncbi:hypothetical protein [Kitasatospora humi]|uniref:hypothetical protein n=1 Tax=Kitasatospora humi TaxID=2893891 RepID=UPI0027E00EA2|nr:hypothetical protein [Kitasatospora humi]